MANIDIKEWQIGNDTYKFKDEEARQQLATKQPLIESVSSTYEENGGSPNAVASTDESGNLTFAFQNLKLKFGDLTNDDKEAIRGPQGASAVFDPNTGNILATLESGIGPSDTNAMTQKAVTDELLVDVEGYPSIPLNGLDLVPYYIASATDKWASGTFSGTVKMGCKLLPVTPGQIITVIPAEGHSDTVAFLTDNSHTVGNTPSFVQDTGRIIVSEGQTISMVVPSGAAYLYVVVLSNLVDITPVIKARYKIKDKIESLSAKEEENSKSANADRNVIDLDTIDVTKGYTTESDYLWHGSNQQTTCCKIVPVTSGKTYRIETNQNYGTKFVFLSSDEHTTGTHIDNVGNIFLVGKGESKVVCAPVGANYLYMYVGDLSGKEGQPSLFAEQEPVRDLAMQTDVKVNHLSEISRNLVLVEPDEEYLDKYFNSEQGRIVDAMAHSMCRVYSVELGADYYATCRHGSVATSIGVAYLDSNEAYIGTDNNLHKEGVAVAYQAKKLNVPSNAVYIVLNGQMPNSSVGKWVPCLFRGGTGKENVTPYAIEYHTAKVNTKPYRYEKNNTRRENTYADSAWAVMWPSSYTESGHPTQVIAMLHGSQGIVTPTIMGYDSANWVKWRNKYLIAGYAVMDINGYGISESSDAKSQHYGCPAAIETIDKAFDYLKAHYNVADKLLIHGSSMGGCVAQTYAKTHPEKVLAIAAFAPNNPLRTSMKGYENVAIAWGYESIAQMVADHYDNMVGYVPFAKCYKLTDGQLIPVDWSGDISEWPSDYDESWTVIEKFPVPIRIWNGSADTTIEWTLNRNIVDAYRRGGSIATLRVVDGANHNLVTGSVEYVMDEAIEFFKQFE